MTSENSPPVHHLTPGLYRELLTPPEGAAFTTANLDSLRYKGIDLSPLLSDRLILQKDLDANISTINRCGGLRWGKMVVSDLARVLGDALSMLPLLSKQEKLLLKYQKADLERSSQLQSELDRTKDELAVMDENFKNAQEIIASLKKEVNDFHAAHALQHETIAQLRSEKAKLAEESSKLAEESSLKDATISSLQSANSDLTKVTEEARSAEKKAKEELVDADANAYTMFIRGFKEARAQIVHFNPALQIDLSKVSTNNQIRTEFSDEDEDEDESEEGNE